MNGCRKPSQWRSNGLLFASSFPETTNHAPLKLIRRDEDSFFKISSPPVACHRPELTEPGSFGCDGSPRRRRDDAHADQVKEAGSSIGGQHRGCHAWHEGAASEELAPVFNSNTKVTGLGTRRSTLETRTDKRLNPWR